MSIEQLALKIAFPELCFRELDGSVKIRTSMRKERQRSPCLVRYHYMLSLPLEIPRIYRVRVEV